MPPSIARGAITLLVLEIGIELAALEEAETPPPRRRTARRRTALSIAAFAFAILIGIVLVPEIAAFAYLAVAARAVLTAEGEGRLTLAPRGGI